MATEKLTALETQVLEQIKASIKAYGDDGVTWACECGSYGSSPRVTGKSLAGAMGSLAKKGIITCYGDGREAQVQFNALEIDFRGYVSGY